MRLAILKPLQKVNQVQAVNLVIARKEIVVNEENQEVGVEGKKVKLRYDISLFYYYIIYKHVSYDNLI